MITTIIPFLICLIGLVIFAVAKDDNAKAKEIGRAMMWCGLLVSLFAVAGKEIHLP